MAFYKGRTKIAGGGLNPETQITTNWGQVGGTISNQTDLCQLILNLKREVIKELFKNTPYVQLPNTQEPAQIYGGKWEEIPEMKGKVMVGCDTSQDEFKTLGKTGGEKEHKLLEEEMPSHTHKIVNEIAPEQDIGITEGTGGDTSQWSFQDNLTTTKYSIKATKTGGDKTHNNLQPYIVVKFWRYLGKE